MIAVVIHITHRKMETTNRLVSPYTILQLLPYYEVKYLKAFHLLGECSE